MRHTNMVFDIARTGPTRVVQPGPVKLPVAGTWAGPSLVSRACLWCGATRKAIVLEEAGFHALRGGYHGQGFWDGLHFRTGSTGLVNESCDM